MLLGRMIQSTSSLDVDGDSIIGHLHRLQLTLAIMLFAFHFNVLYEHFVHNLWASFENKINVEQNGKFKIIKNP